MTAPIMPTFPDDSPAGVTPPRRGTAAAASSPPPSGAAAADLKRTGGGGHPPSPPVPGPARESLQAPGAEGGPSRARALAAAPTIRGGQGTPSSRSAEREGKAAPGMAVPGAAQASPPGSEGVPAGAEGGPGGNPAPAAGPPRGPGGAALTEVAVPPAPGLTGEEFRKAWKAADSALARAQRAGRSRYPVKRAGDGYQPGKNRRQPPGGTS